MEKNNFNFSDFYQEYRQRLIRFTYNYIRNDVVAEDIVSDAMIYYWENRSKFPDNINPAAYVLTSIKHRCIDFLRHERIKQEAEGELAILHIWELDTRIASLEELNPKDIFTEEIMNITRCTLSMLPEQTRRIFTMSRYENLSHKEIAEQLGISVKSVEFHIGKAIKVLRVTLKDYLPAAVIALYIDNLLFFAICNSAVNQ